MTENVSKRLDNVTMVGAFVNQSENFKVVEIIEHDGKQAVDARILHEYLGVKKTFSSWIKMQIERCDLLEGVDYEALTQKVSCSNGVGYSQSRMYVLSLDAAKEISMMSQCEKGKLARRYFIEVEKAARAKYEEQQLDKKASEAFDIKLKWLNFLPGYLNLSDVSKLAMAKKIAEPLGLPTPEYVSAPNGAKHSATELLKMHNVGLSARKFNELAVKAGLLELKERKGTTKVHKYCEITKKGLAYGENDINEKNMNQVQPHWYDSKFGEVLEIIGCKLSKQTDMFASGEAHK